MCHLVVLIKPFCIWISLHCAVEFVKKFVQCALVCVVVQSKEEICAVCFGMCSSAEQGKNLCSVLCWYETMNVLAYVVLLLPNVDNF
jgi:hypothetical protein